MFQKVFLLNPDMLPRSLLASRGGKRVGKKKKIQKRQTGKTRLLGSKVLRRPSREEEGKRARPFLQTSSLSPFR